MKKVLFVIFLLGTAIWSYAQTVKEFFVTDNPIAFDNTHFYLGWSSNPSKGYFLHEYFPKGETPEQFNKMFTVSIVETGISAKDAAMAKANELTKRKENDNICNYKVYLQFLIFQKYLVVENKYFYHFSLEKTISQSQH